MDYRNKNILAPMVRVGTLAYRLLALEYGADIVYSEEIIDYKMVMAKRKVNEFHNIIEYWVDGTQKPIFQTCEKEKGKVVFQMGTCDPQRALECCKLVEDDVAAIDVNMGCPKEFSVKGGMGSALLKKPDLVKQILTTLVNGSSKPITCKIRCLPSLQETLDLCKMIEACGVKALCVHGRFQHERSSNPPHTDYIQEITKVLKIPVIANGGSNTIQTYEDIIKFKEETGASSVMLARVAMWNSSIFRKEGLIELDDVIKRYLQITLESNNFFFNTKYAIQQMLHKELTSERGLKVLESTNPEEIYELFGMLNEYKEMVKLKEENIDKTIIVTKRKNENSPEEANVQNNEQTDIKKLKSSCDKMVITKSVRYVKNKMSSRETPKSILHTWTIHNNIAKPVYKTETKLPERVYKSTLELDNIFYETPYWEVNKQLTEQAVAMVCIEYLGITTDNILQQKETL